MFVISELVESYTEIIKKRKMNISIMLNLAKKILNAQNYEKWTFVYLVYIYKIVRNLKKLRKLELLIRV